MNAASFERMQRRFDEAVINADGCDLDVQRFDPKFVNEFLLDRLLRFRAQAAHTFVGVVAGKGRQVHA